MEEIEKLMDQLEQTEYNILCLQDEVEGWKDVSRAEKNAIIKGLQEAWDHAEEAMGNLIEANKCLGE